MMRRRAVRWLLPLSLLILAAHGAMAQHADVLLQRDGDKIATGLADWNAGSWTMGARVFAHNFPSDFFIDNPGFNALGNNPPAGYSALPGSSAVGWDFLPMQIETTVSNLWYWDGEDADGNGLDAEDVEFVLAPGYRLWLEGAPGIAAADGSDQLIPGGTLGSTGSNGSMHVHRWFELDSGNPLIDPADGIYLIALQVRMEVLEPSDPFFIVFGTLGSSLEARSAAVQWVEERVDTLAVISDSLPGDFNHDGVVDGADFVVWRKTDGPQEDYNTWRAHFGMSAADGASGLTVPVGGAAVPEPHASCVVPIALLLVGGVVRCRGERRGQAHFSSESVLGT